MRPRLFSCSSSSSSSNSPLRSLREDLEDRDENHDVEAGDEIEEEARHRRADDAGPLVEARGVVDSTWLSSARIPKLSSTARRNTIVEWPSEKKKPTLSGRLPSAISLRVVLSMAAMWSASKAWRIPSV